MHPTPGHGSPASTPRGAESAWPPASTSSRSSPDRLVALSLRRLWFGDFGDVELIYEALARRGFLVTLRGDDILVPRGPHEADICLVSRFVRVQRLHNPLWQARLIPRGDDPWDDAEAILELRAPKGLFTRRPFAEPESWISYRRQHHGHCVALRGNEGQSALDAGIAMVIKALPLLGVATWASCSGHGQGPAWLQTRTSYDLRWLRAVLSTVAPKLTACRVDVDSEVLKASFVPDGLADDQLIALLDDLQRLARSVLEPGVSRSVLETRRAVLEELGEEKPELVEFERHALDALGSLAHRKGTALA